MAQTYRECPACGKRALRIATRCPQCGHELLTQPIRSQVTRPVTGWTRPLLTAAMVLAGIGIVMVVMGRGAANDVNGNVNGKVTTTAAALPPAALDTTYAAAATYAEGAPEPVPPDSAPSPDAVPRIARTWTKVHDKRSVDADLVAVLLPGDTVLVDSLRGRWWRVALEGRVIGYVYTGTLTTERPTGSDARRRYR
jgi:hypothetical protein